MLGSDRPLADLMRPRIIDEVVGQEHFLGESGVLRGYISAKRPANLVFYGPPGTGKTTLAEIIARNTDKKFKKLNCTTASIADIKQIISEINTFEGCNGVLLYLDEIQYFNKKQQQILLEFVENGQMILIASTTENPYFAIYGALLSRMIVFEFKSVPKGEVLKALRRAVKFLKEKNKLLKIDDNVLDLIVNFSGGDVRKALNILDFASISVNYEQITSEIISQIANKSSSKYDKSGDEYYDLLSAFQKSMRGSDPDAAVYYLARLLDSGDLVSVCRRLAVCACEDVGLAYPQAVNFVKSCIDIALQVGMPEAKIPLADAVIMVSVSPKSNSAYLAISKAIADVKSGKIGSIPRHLQNNHFDGVGNKEKGQNYLYPHNFDNHFVSQQYLPDIVKSEKYYKFGENKNEQNFKAFFDNLKGN